MRNINWLLRRQSNEKGYTLIIVLVAMALTAMIGTWAVNTASSQSLMQKKTSGITEDALNYAQSGVNHYLWRLNKDATFYKNNPQFVYQRQYSPDRAVYYSLKEVPAVGEPERYFYRVELVVPIIDGVELENRVTVRCTAWTRVDPERKKTVEVEMGRRTFAEFGGINNRQEERDGSGAYWGSNEKLYGPYHTNKKLYCTGSPKFYGPVTHVTGVEKASAQFFAGQPKKVDPITWPASNSKLRELARIGGDYYNGRACIFLQDDRYSIRYWDKDNNTWVYNGKPYSYERKSPTDSTLVYKSSGNIYNTFAQFAAAAPPLPLPDNGVIYVDGISPSLDVNGGSLGMASYKQKFNRDYGNVFISGRLKGKLTVACAGDIYITGYNPTIWDSLATGAGITYKDTTFNITGNGEVKVLGDTNNIMGLIADHAVSIMHYYWFNQPVGNDGNINNLCWSPAGDSDVSPQNIEINAAIFVVNESFGIEDYKRISTSGYRIVRGSIAQNYVAITVDSDNKGYKEDNAHDPRMLYMSPPHFIEPNNTGWVMGRWKNSDDHIPERM